MVTPEGHLIRRVGLPYFLVVGSKLGFIIRKQGFFKSLVGRIYLKEVPGNLGGL